jgi:hypothetical protein
MRRATSRPLLLTTLSTITVERRINTGRKPQSLVLLLFVAMTETLATGHPTAPPFSTILEPADELRRSAAMSSFIW